MQYFLSKPYCEKCGELRLACLCIHHINGKHDTYFETLCHNCHMVFHAGELGSLTYAQAQAELDEKQRQNKELEERNKKILELSGGKGLSAKEVATILNISEPIVRRILSEAKKVSP